MMQTRIPELENIITNVKLAIVLMVVPVLDKTEWTPSTLYPPLIATKNLGKSPGAAIWWLW